MRMHKIIETSPFKINIKLITKPKNKAPYKDDPGLNLILRCNSEARKIREVINE